MKIAGHCPMGCGEGLILSELGEIFCAGLLCPRPAAAAEILADAESGHVVTFTAEGFTIRHPLRERLDDALMDCEVHVKCARYGDEVSPGTYRAARNARGAWELTPLDDRT
jgi:hypothetical protein